MTLLIEEYDDPIFAPRIVHFPSNPDKFEFDSEVSEIFEDMARRSIPMYQETHTLICDAAAEHLIGSDYSIVLDIGTSRGQFFKSLWDFFAIDCKDPIPDIGCVGIDSSKDMLAIAEKELPNVLFMEMDVSEYENLMNINSYFDVVVMSYVLQFIPRNKRSGLLATVYEKMNPGGILFISSKYAIENDFGPVYSRMYRDFRESNGYSQEEIDAKNTALANSMWVDTKEETTLLLSSCGFKDITDLCSMMQFGTLVARK